MKKLLVIIMILNLIGCVSKKAGDIYQVRWNLNQEDSVLILPEMLIKDITICSVLDSILSFESTCNYVRDSVHYFYKIIPLKIDQEVIIRVVSSQQFQLLLNSINEGFYDGAFYYEGHPFFVSGTETEFSNFFGKSNSEFSLTLESQNSKPTYYRAYPGYFALEYSFYEYSLHQNQSILNQGIVCGDTIK